MRNLVIFGLLVALSAPAFAEESTDKSKTKDPNRMVCRYTEVIGSRLQAQKTCMTAMQWTQFEREQRNSVDRVQQQRVRPGE